MNTNNDATWQLALVVGAVLFIGALYLLKGGQEEAKPKSSKVAATTSKKESAPAATKPKEVKAAPANKPAAAKPAAAKPEQAKEVPAAKPAAEPKSKAAPKPVAAPAPVPSPKNVAAVIPEITSSGSELKLKKPKESAEQKEARLKRQEVAKVVKKEAESSARAVPSAAVLKKVVEEEWEVVVDKKKDRPKKKAEEPAPVAAAEAPPKPVVVVPVIVKETKSLVIDSKRVGGIIGPKGVTLHQIQDSTGTTIQIPKSDPEKPVPSVSVSVTGQAAGVAKAITILTEIANTGTSPTLLGFDPRTAAPTSSAVSESAAAPAPVPKVDVSTLAVKVESRKMGAIIGPKGATLHAIQDATETEINTTTAPNADITSVVITGPAAGVAKAGKAINELATKGYCMLLSGESFQESHIHVPPRFLAEIIGKSGATIRAIQDSTGARVVIPSSAPRPGDARGADSDAPVKVILAGPKEGIAQAKQIITQITELYYHPVTHPGVVHVNLDIPEKYFNFIIGVKGSEIKHIQNNFKVSVKIPDRNTVFQTVLVIGEHANCENAVRYINKLVTQVDSREQERAAEDQWGSKDGEEDYDPDLMNRYVYSRQNKNRDDETPPAAEPVNEPVTARARPISERPPGFSPMGKSDDREELDANHGAVPLNWGPVKSTMTW